MDIIPKFSPRIKYCTKYVADNIYIISTKYTQTILQLRRLLRHNTTNTHSNNKKNQIEIELLVSKWNILNQISICIAPPKNRPNYLLAVYITLKKIV